MQETLVRSVTQQFNTTTSMGRLTLNILLSFAQFEREVIGERIRDKIAASKKKGMWMGGMPPLGYREHDRSTSSDCWSKPVTAPLRLPPSQRPPAFLKPSLQTWLATDAVLIDGASGALAKQAEAAGAKTLMTSGNPTGCQARWCRTLIPCRFPADRGATSAVCAVPVPSSPSTTRTPRGRVTIQIAAPIAEATRGLFEPSQDRAPAPAASKAQRFSFQISAVLVFSLSRLDLLCPFAITRFLALSSGNKLT